MEQKIYYDTEKCKAVPIEDVCAALGLSIRGHKVKIRDEKEPSTQIYPAENRWYDFGRGRGGDVINLVQEYLQCDFNAAKEFVAQVGGIEPENGKTRSDFLTNTEWAKLGIAGDIASKNFDIDLATQPLDVAKELSQKGNMTVNELRKQHPAEYENILYSKAIPLVNDLREDYFYDVYSTAMLCLENGLDWHKVAQVKFADEIKDLHVAEVLLKRACSGTKIRVGEPQEYEPEKDLERLLSGDVHTLFQHKNLREYNVLKQSTEDEKTNPGKKRARYIGVNSYNDNGTVELNYAYRGREYTVTDYKWNVGESKAEQHRAAQSRIDAEIEQWKVSKDVMQTVQDKRREAADHDPVGEALDMLCDDWKDNTGDNRPSVLTPLHEKQDGIARQGKDSPAKDEKKDDPAL